MSDSAKRATEIQRMFGEVAPRYDLLNHVLSASLDHVWRRRAAGCVEAGGKGPVLDLCCGTGDQALAISRRENEVVAADFCIPMLARARRKYSATERPAPVGLAADALHLPFPDGRFAATTVSFGLRNVPELDTALDEIHRVLVPGGRLVVLEFAMPILPILSGLYRVYFQRVLPWIGRRISDSASAYSYLPDSVPAFPQRDDFLTRLRGRGFETASYEDLSGGIVCLYRAVKPAVAAEPLLEARA